MFLVLFEDYEAGTGIHTDGPTGFHVSWVISNPASIIPTVLCTDNIPAAALPVF